MTDKQCSSCGGICNPSGCERENIRQPVGWLEGPYGEFRRNPKWVLGPMPRSVAWSIPLHANRQPAPQRDATDPAIKALELQGGKA